MSENKHSPKKPRSTVLERVYGQSPKPTTPPSKNVPTSRGL